MKVAVLGSWRPKNKDTWNLEYGINEFKNACESIGAFLDSEGHTLVTALQQEDTADLYAARAFTDQNRLITYDKILGRENLLAAHNVASLNAQAIIIIGGAVGSYNAGLMALNANKLVIPIACFGGAARQLLSNPIRNKFSGIICNTLCDLDLHKDGWQKTLTNNIDKLLDKYPRILIIHGRSPDREKLFDLIKNKLTDENNQKITSYKPNAIILSRQDVHAGTITELFEKYAAQVDAAIALVTPDDLGVSVFDDHEQPILAKDLYEFKQRARQNVWIEVGWFWGKLRRHNLMLLTKGQKVEIPTDMLNVRQSYYKDDPFEIKDDIFKFIKDMRDGE